MQEVVIAAAQYCSVPGDVDRNIVLHREFIATAVRENVDLLVFPELSLTGYELSIAREQALTLQDPRLDALRADARTHRMNVVLGAPLAAGNGETCYIGAIIFTADGTLYAYTKQHLHGEEIHLFSRGEGGPLLTVRQHAVGLAICADISHADHPAKAAQSGASIYIAGVLISHEGYQHDTSMLQGYAGQHGMAILMANHGAPTGGWQPAGKSALWDEQGEQVIAAQEEGNALIIGRKNRQGWHGSLHPLS
ncbi:carbon-nitrogen hydrolase family protein [Edaphovirga cremea]|uniref:carbon-nitrogen hydrolase family protein n=1 Tax=Edaphovirga cremea TaxID=2267246 RepID=UPI000DEFF496|nr:carbon-nitrogen hydrolase family protein [Edaphovirga cremea]